MTSWNHITDSLRQQWENSRWAKLIKVWRTYDQLLSEKARCEEAIAEHRLEARALVHEIGTATQILLGLSLYNDGAPFAVASPIQKQILVALVTTNRLAVVAQEIKNEIDLRENLPPTISDVDVGQLVKSVVTDTIAKRYRYINMPVESPPTLPLAKADKDLLARSLMAIMHNAARSTPWGGFIHVSVSSEDSARAVDIRVTDQGQPMLEEHRADPFARFTPVSSESSGEKRLLMGLGLHAVNEWIRLMGGEIQISETQGTGNTWVIRLPATPYTVAPRMVYEETL